MDALTLLLHRRSVARLVEPAPGKAALENIIRSGMRAPDHGTLRPWRFCLIEGEGRDRFGRLMESATRDRGGDEKALDKARKAPFRAPMIIAVVARCESHPNVPQWEQVVSAGCAVMAMQMAAQAQGFGGIWRSGALIDNPQVREAFGCRSQDSIVGFLYLGTPQLTASGVTNPADIASFVSRF